MRAIEVLRRVVLVAGAFMAAAMVVWPAQAVWRVDVADFARIQQRKVGLFNRAMALAGSAESAPTPYSGDLDAFIAKQIEGRLTEVDRATWGTFFDQVQSTLAGKSKDLARYLEDDDSPSYLFFPLSYAPLSALAGRMGDQQPVMYLKLRGGDGSPYLSLTFQRSHDAMRYAPGFVAYPWRQYAVWPFLIALAGYCLLPVRRPGSDEFCYRQGSAVVAPDWLGLVMAGLFFVLPILIIADNASSLRPWSLLGMDDGWGILTLVFWFMALLFLANVVVGLWYATFSLRVTNDRICRQTLLSYREYAFADIESAEPATWGLPRWLKITMVVAGLFNWRLLGAILVGATSTASGIRLRCRDGRTVGIWLNHLRRPGELLPKLDEHGVAVPDEVRKHFGASKKADVAVAPVMPATSSISIARVVVLVILGGAAIAITYWPQPVRAVQPPVAEASPETYARRMAILKEMQEIHAKMELGLKAMKAATGDARSELAKAQQQLMDRFEALSNESDRLDRPVEK